MQVSIPIGIVDHEWAEWLKGVIVPGCEVIYDLDIDETTIIFESEEHKNWFILQWL